MSRLGELFEAAKATSILFSATFLAVHSISGAFAFANESNDSLPFSVWHCAIDAAVKQKDIQNCIGQFARECVEEVVAAGGNPSIRATYDCQMGELAEWSSAWIVAISNDAWRGSLLKMVLNDIRTRFLNVRICQYRLTKLEPNKLSFLNASPMISLLLFEAGTTNSQM